MGRTASTENATLCGDRACRVREMQARARFSLAARNPSAEIARVECAKCRRECDLSQLAFFGEISWRRERCFSSNGHSEVDVTSQRGSGSQTEELCALLFPFTSSSNALEDELSCHRLAAGGGFGRPGRHLVHYISSEDLHHLPLPAADIDTQTQTGTHTHTSHTETPHTASKYSDTHTQTGTHT